MSASTCPERARVRPGSILERRDLPGGACVTEEIYPGFRFSTAAYLVSLLQEKVVQELDLHRFGYRVDPKDPAFFSLYPDGRTLTMWQDSQRTAAEIARAVVESMALQTRDVVDAMATASGRSVTELRVDGGALS